MKKYKSIEDAERDLIESGELDRFLEEQLREDSVKRTMCLHDAMDKPPFGKSNEGK